MTEQKLNIIARQQYQRLLTIAKRYLKDEEDIADAVQEALVSLWLFRKRIDDKRDVNALLTIIIKNVCLMHLRKEKPMTMQLSITIKATDNPHHDLEAREKSEAVMTAMQHLSPTHQSLLQMYYSAELSIQQIATIRNTTQTAVKQMLMRARNALRKEIERRDI